MSKRCCNLATSSWRTSIHLAALMPIAQGCAVADHLDLDPTYFSGALSFTWQVRHLPPSMLSARQLAKGHQCQSDCEDGLKGEILARHCVKFLKHVSRTRSSPIRLLEDVSCDTPGDQARCPQESVRLVWTISPPLVVITEVMGREAATLRLLRGRRWLILQP